MVFRLKQPIGRTIRRGLGRIDAPIFLCGLVLILAALLLFAWYPAFLRVLDLRLYDTFLKWHHTRQLTHRVCIVEIDAPSLSAFGQWPWPRYRLADLVERIREAGAKTIALDIILAEPDRTSLDRIKSEIVRDYGIQVDWTGIPTHLLDHDRAFADSIRENRVILSYKFFAEASEDAEKVSMLHPVNVAVINQTGAGKAPSALYQGEDVLSNIDTLMSAARSSGFINAVADADGIIRRVPLLMALEGSYYPSLAFASLLQYAGISQAIVTTGRNGILNVRMGGIVIPTDGRGNLLVHYRGKRRTFQTVSAADILKGDAAVPLLKDKIVLIGASVEGLADIRTTPFDRFSLGVEIHASIIDNILQQDFIAVPPWSRGLAILAIIGFGLIATVLLSCANAGWSAATLGTCLLLVLSGSGYLYAQRGLYISPLFPLLTIGAVFTVLTALKFRIEERRVKERNRELAVTQHATIRSLVSLAETRDNDTGGHIRRTQRYVRVLATSLKEHPKFEDFLDDETIDLLYMSAPLHDAGKVGIPDSILLKPGKLDEAEFERMKDHTVLGGDAIRLAEADLGKRSFLRFAREIAYSHQEKWDGSGYPSGLRGEDIPISARLMAIADVYDALISRRVYKKPYPHHVAVNAVAMSKGSHFDPDMIDAFLTVKDEFRRIALELADTEEQRMVLLQDGP